jgi:SAM-dependent methyltransferase
MQPADDYVEEPGIETSVPNVARMWDYYLGGSDNYDADREAARLVLGAAPDVPLAALENREFLRHVVRFLIEDANITQFIDIGPGLPTQSNVHQLARKHDVGARVAYIDNDPTVIAHGRTRLTGVSGVTLIRGDLRRPDNILGNPELQELINLSAPVALCMTLVLHFLTDEDDPYGVVDFLRDSLYPGSYIVISHVTGQDHGDEILGRITGVYDRTTSPLVVRTETEIAQFFDGLDLVPPGVVFLSQWRPTNDYYAGGGTRWAYAGVGRKPVGTLLEKS